MKAASINIRIYDINLCDDNEDDNKNINHNSILEFTSTIILTEIATGTKKLH